MFDWLKSLFETPEQKVARLKKEEIRRQKEYEEAVAEQKRIQAAEKREAELAAAREKKARKELSDKIKQAKAFAKEKKLRRTRRNGQTVYVNEDNQIVNYAILYYLLFHTNNETYGRDSDYSTPIVMQNAQEHASDFVGSFGGGESGGGGASSSWSPDVSSSGSFDSGSSSDFGGSFGGGDSGGGGASGSW